MNALAMSGAAALLLVAHAAVAAEANRRELTHPSGACVAATAQDAVRYRTGSVRNAGSVPVYVLCSLGGDWRYGGSNDAAWRVALRFKNTGAAAVSFPCTFHTGYAVTSTVTSQDAVAMVQALPGNTGAQFDVGADEAPLATPTFVCRLEPRVEIEFMLREYEEGIDATI